MKVDDIECIQCPNCKEMTVDQTAFEHDRPDWLHCIECGWIDGETGKPEIIED